MRLFEAGQPPETPTRDHFDRGIESCVAAYDAGYRLFDTADVYGRGACEQIFGEALKRVKGFRDSVVIATKCGIRHAQGPVPDAPQRFDFSADHILGSCDGSLKRLGIDTIDIYQLHRPDALGDPHEVASAFDKLKQQGKVRHFGVSNFLPSQVMMLQRWLDAPLLVNQVKIHLMHLACFEDGTLDHCLERQITPLAWSPLASGLLGADATVPPDHPGKATVEDVHSTLDAIARGYGVTRPIVALAWLLKHPAGIIPIVGSVNPQRIRDATRADEIDMTREQWYQLYVAARGEPMP
jgi:predicted oxidoreductase